MGNQQEVSEVQLAWLAGLLNGDGCFSLTFRRRDGRLKCDLSLTLTQCDPAIVERADDLINKLGVTPGISEYEPSGAGIRTKWNMRISKMAHILAVIDAVLPYMVGEKSAQAKLMKRYIERRLPFTDHSMRVSAGKLEDDRESIEIASDFYKARRLDVPQELAQVLRDYPSGEYAQAGGSAQHRDR